MLRRTKVQYDVPDLACMAFSLRHLETRFVRDEISHELRSFADWIEGQANAVAAAQKVAAWLHAATSAPPTAERGWTGLAALGFWTVRNAACIWQMPSDGLPHCSGAIYWSEMPEDRTEFDGVSLTLKMHPYVQVYAERSLIVGPRWFIDAANLLFQMDQSSIEFWRPVARCAIDQYFRQLIASESRPIDQRDVFVHPAVEQALRMMRIRKRDDGGALQLDGYASASNVGNTPGAIIKRLMDSVKDSLDSLPESTFVPWRSTLLGLIPPDKGWVS